MKCMRCGKEMKNTIGGNYICDNCGFAVNDLVYRGQTATLTDVPNPPIIDNNIAYPSIGDNPNYNFWAPQGWVCPKCGAVLSPNTAYCPFCAPGNNKSTITSTNTPYSVDYTHHDFVNGTNSGQFVNPNVNTTISGE